MARKSVDTGGQLLVLYQPTNDWVIWEVNRIGKLWEVMGNDG